MFLKTGVYYMITLLQIRLTMKPDDPLHTSDEEDSILDIDVNRLLDEDEDEPGPNQKADAELELGTKKQEEAETEIKKQKEAETKAKKCAEAEDKVTKDKKEMRKQKVIQYLSSRSKY